MWAPLLPRSRRFRRSEGLGEESDGAWAHLGVQCGLRQGEAVPRRRLDRAINGEPLADLWHASDRLHAARWEAPSPNREEAEATFVLAKDPNGARVGGGNRPLEVLVT